ncbi:MAG: hypothetical protein KOO69_03525 [Victivallales bacterium]|nr:hypothetical protein [Victivallales bacterium]
MLVITEEIKNYLDTTEGRKFFREITPEMSAGLRFEFKKSLMRYSPTLRRRFAVLSLLHGKINEINIKKTLDK